MMERKAAGVLLICENTGNFLLLKRSDKVNFPDCWAVVGGAIEENETPAETVKRELMEETSISGDNIILEFFESQYMFRPFDLFIGYCDKEHQCKLNDENSGWGWFNMDNLPDPLFPTLYSSLVRIF
jgi:8-oxo-dGTP diphosphatase